jgi:hypothetical protein
MRSEARLLDDLRKKRDEYSALVEARYIRP